MNQEALLLHGLADELEHIDKDRLDNTSYSFLVHAIKLINNIVEKYTNDKEITE